MEDEFMGLGVVVASKEILTAVREFSLKLLGPAAEQFGLIGGDWARAWRANNLALYQQKI